MEHSLSNRVWIFLATKDRRQIKVWGHDGLGEEVRPLHEAAREKGGVMPNFRDQAKWYISNC